MSTPRDLDPKEEARLWRGHACACIDDFFAADAEADAALEAVADFAARGDFHRKEDVIAFYKLNWLAGDAEHRRRRTRNALSLALCALVNCKRRAAEEEAA